VVVGCWQIVLLQYWGQVRIGKKPHGDAQGLRYRLQDRIASWQRQAQKYRQ
jgi:hypothetical protein